MKENQKYMELTRWAVEMAGKAGAEGAEAFLSDSESIQISVSGRQVEQVNAVREAGIGLRLLQGQKMVFGSTNELTQSSIQNLVNELMRKVPFHTPDEFNVIPGKENSVLPGNWAGNADLLSYDPRLAEVPVQEKVQQTLTLEKGGLDYSPKITGSMMTVYQDSTAHIYLANSHGVAGWFPTSGWGGFIGISAAEGEDHQSGSYSQGTCRYADYHPAEIGRIAAEKAVRMLGAKPIPSCEIPMVVSPEIGTQLLSFLVGMLSADDVQKGRSLFAGKLEQTVASSLFNLIDDGKLKGGLATSPVDGEGVPQQTTPLIVNGILKNYLFDSYTARKGKTRSTGNRSRSGFGSAGGIGPTNLYLKPGADRPEEVIGQTSRGFYLTDAIGIFAGIDTASGDFSIPVAGFLIEGGKLIKPVRGITIGGNLFQLLKSVDRISNDLTWFQTTGCPTFRVATIKIAGGQSS